MLPFSIPPSPLPASPVIHSSELSLYHAEPSTALIPFNFYCLHSTNNNKVQIGRKWNMTESGGLNTAGEEFILMLCVW